MNKELFNYILQNQRKWAEQYRRQEEEKANIRRILNRKFISKQAKSEDWIKEELIKSLKIGELELIENLVGKGFDRLDFLELDHSIR
jgi:hypothetical protein